MFLQAPATAEPFQVVDAAFDTPNFTCSWNSSVGEDSHLLVISGAVIHTISPTQGVVSQQSAGTITAAVWVINSATQIIVAGGNKITVRDALTWSVLVEMQDVIPTEGDEIRIHHLHSVDAGLLIVGYLNVSNGFDASLALVKLDFANKTQPLKVLNDLHEAVCMSDQMDAEHHRYFTHFINPW